MEKEFVPYPLALRLKALGFDEPCFGRWWFRTDMHKLNEEELEIIRSNYFELPEHYTLAPTYSQVFRWFRVTYRYFYSIRIGVNGFTYQISNMFDSSNPDKVFDFGEANIYSSTCSSGEGWYETYEEAELACLDKLLEIVESKSE